MSLGDKQVQFRLAYIKQLYKALHITPKPQTVTNQTRQLVESPDTEVEVVKVLNPSGPQRPSPYRIDLCSIQWPYIMSESRYGAPAKSPITLGHGEIAK